MWLCSPETAAASALRGVITDPRDLGIDAPVVTLPAHPTIEREMLVRADPARRCAPGRSSSRGPNIAALPEMKPIADTLEVPVLLRVGDDISTDEIMPAGARVLPYRSNVPKIAEFCFDVVDATYPKRALAQRARGGHAIVGGSNYGQGSSREHAALAPRYLGLWTVVARSFARIHYQNLVSFGILPLVFVDPEDHDRIGRGDTLRIEGVEKALRAGERVRATVNGQPLALRHTLSPRQVDIVLAGGLVPQQRASAQRPGAPEAHAPR